ncbi:CHAT domain-containing protein [Nocardia bhagyanarayanae]|uniref:CHAT domain-containing protein n=2 Tax=Nocardia bhagyanarayanae TaxID=1215925 RepID=A0A543FE83_9NOCA|nr:CHAT domain-containing protein [Nocardia bhagyanarayanae]
MEALHVDLLRANDELLRECLGKDEFAAALMLATTGWEITRTIRGDDEVVLERATTVLLVAQKMGDNERAAAFADYIVRGWRELVPPRHPDLLQALFDAASVAADAGEFERALELYTELATSTGPGEPDPTADAWLRAQSHLLAGKLAAYFQSGDKAEEHWQRTVHYASQLSPEVGRPLQIGALLGIGHLMQCFGDLAGATEPLVRVHGLVREHMEASSEPVWLSEEASATAAANELLHLGIRLIRAQDLREAEHVLQSAMDLFVHTGDRSGVAHAVHMIGQVYHSMGHFDHAERNYQHALKVFRGSAASPEQCVPVLTSLGALYEMGGRYEEATAALREVVAAQPADAGPSERVTVLNSLARLDFRMRRDRDCEQRLTEAIALLRPLPDNADRLSKLLANLAELFASTGRAVKALTTFDEALALDDRWLIEVFSRGSQRQWLAAASASQFRVDQMLSLVFAELSGDPAAAAIVASAALRRKGLTTRAARSLIDRAARMSDADPLVSTLAQKAAELRAMIGAWRLAGPAPGQEKEHEDRLFAGRRQLDAMEAEIATRTHRVSDSDLFGRPLGELVSAIPSQAALVEFRRFTAYDFHSEDRSEAGMRRGTRYAAIILRDRTNAVMLDLADGDLIDRLVDTSVRELSGQQAETDSSADLRRALIEPLVPHLDGVEHLMLSPDGELTRLPFEALPLDDGGHVMDRWLVSYVSASQDLTRGTASSSHTEPMVIAAPDFDLVASSGATGPFAPLPGAYIEGEEVAALLEVTSVTGAHAVKTEVLSARSPLVLHLATHGFFASAVRPPVLRPEQFAEGMTIAAADAQRQLVSLDGVLSTPIEFVEVSPKDDFKRLSGEGVDDPMLRSGLALAGANSWLVGQDLPPAAGNGVLTAADLADMDLTGTKLVVLSACDTAHGDSHVGEGVFGLRRAVTLAGARCLVMALWKVPDRQSTELMIDFYTRLRTGEPPPIALDNARKALRRRYPHPAYWAAFVCQGGMGSVLQTEEPR